jgi:hypothetical protein
MKLLHSLVLPLVSVAAGQTKPFEDTRIVSGCKKVNRTFLTKAARKILSKTQNTQPGKWSKLGIIL